MAEAAGTEGAGGRAAGRGPQAINLSSALGNYKATNHETVCVSTFASLMEYAGDPGRL